MSEFSELSRSLTASLTKEEKKNGEIFFTPPKCIQHILALLRAIPEVYENIKTILEPSCGSGEFISVIQSFRDPRTHEFIACYFGNNAVNTTELNHMLPIYEI